MLDKDKECPRCITLNHSVGPISFLTRWTKLDSYPVLLLARAPRVLARAFCSTRTWRVEQKARAKTRGARARRRTGYESRTKLLFNYSKQPHCMISSVFE